MYAVYNENKKVYLTNESGANSFFSVQQKNNMLVTPTDGSDTFRICKENGERYVIFYYTNMDFNANRLYNASFTAGTYEVVLLEKKDKAEAGDIVPGYQRVSKVTSGKKYLIANIFNKDNKDHVIVLYPTNGTGNQTKLLGAAEKRITPTEATVTIKANEIGRTTTVIDGVTYNIVCDEPATVNDKTTLSTDAQVAEINAGKEKLMQSAQKLFAKVYEQSQGAQGAGPNPGAGAGPNPGPAPEGFDGDDVVDGDYKRGIILE